MSTSNHSNIRHNFMSSLITGGRVGLLATLAFAAACIDATSPLQHEGRPAVLEFSIDGYGAPSRQLELRGDTLVARKRPFIWVPNAPTDSVRVVPTAEQWRAFWAAADEAGVQRWHTEYNAEQIQDGEGWIIRIASGGREINSWGSNAYPDRNGHEHEGVRTAEWNVFKTSLNTLAGVTWF
jgi:hypothetical protein